ncbi:MAG: ribonuclease P protein component [Bacteroidetes bacterium]|uniref:Ribonuclease P protein component n=1 Tax=Candidatus Cryptobacteroides gallistercoris TaxID=2840765 RepID=A0A940DL98_9BACT|nr:ribonuclease P protein component [Candidatus Cryptobacteroides gallistercoris]
MDSRSHRTFAKRERLCGKAAISRLLTEGRSGYAGCLRYCFLSGNGEDCDRIMVSVPKKLFRRAVKRNLLKRRMRESFRLQKEKLGLSEHADMMLVYNVRDIRPFGEIFSSVGKVLENVSNARK